MPITDEQACCLAARILDSLQMWDAEAERAAQAAQNPDVYTEVMLDRLRDAIVEELEDCE
jgi:hypothetical protein